MQKKKISELAETTDPQGLWVLVTDANNDSRKFNLGNLAGGSGNSGGDSGNGGSSESGNTGGGENSGGESGGSSGGSTNGESAEAEKTRPRLPNYCENFPTLYRQPFFGFLNEHQHFTDRQF